jgi:phospholipid transport system substrate-binding protein
LKLLHHISVVLLISAAACAWAEAGAEPAEESGAMDAARSAVEGFHDTLLEVMQSGLDFRGRAEVLTPAVRGAFDLHTIARLSLGSKQWRDLAEADQKRFLDTLFDLVVANYAANFKSYNGQVFESLSVDEGKKGQVVVKTHLVRKNGDPVRLDYYLRASGEAPQIFNIVADGVSDLSVRRADYSAIIQKDGFEGLLQSLARNIDEYAKDDEAG